MAACDAKVGKYFLPRDTTAGWLSADPVLCDGLEVYDKTANKTKVGDGVKKWSELAYLEEGSAGGGGSEITDPTKRTSLRTNTNWDNPARPHAGPADEIDFYYFKYTGSVITGQNTHDYYVGQDITTGSWYEYAQSTMDGVTTFIRRPLQLS